MIFLHSLDLIEINFHHSRFYWCVASLIHRGIGSSGATSSIDEGSCSIPETLLTFNKAG